MLVQALAEHADTYLAEQLSDEAWEKKTCAISGRARQLWVVPERH